MQKSGMLAGGPSGGCVSEMASYSLDSRVFENDGHWSEAFRQLQDFRQSGLLCDCTIIVDDRSFRCHKVVLAASIPYFQSMFHSEMVESHSNEITIKDISHSAMEALLTYAYTGRIFLTADTVQPLLYAASILQMDSVCGACEDFLTHYLTTQNCLAIRAFAIQHNCVQLIRDVDMFTQDRFEQLVNSEDFLQVTSNHIMDMVSSADLNVSSEAQVFESVLLWIGHDTTNRLSFLPGLLSKLRLCQLRTEYLLNNVKNHEWIKDDPICSGIVGNAMACQMVAANLATGTAAHVGVDMDACRPRKTVAGVIFCVGGRGTTGDPFRSIEAYDLRRDRWISVAEMSTKRRHVGVVSADKKLFAIGGHDGHAHLASAEVFNPETNTWRVVKSMETHRRGIAVGFLSGAIYAVGGLDDSACFNTVERYDVECDTWSFVAPMNTQRGGVGVAALRGCLYACGGNDGSSSLDTCEKYDPHLNKWTFIAAMNHRRAGAGVVVLNGYLYAIGGFDDNSPLCTCERYCPTTNSWCLIANMSCPRGGVGVAALGGRLVCCGGHDGISYLASAEAYDPAKNTWEALASISQCRAGAGMAWCNCSMENLHPVVASVAACV